MALENLKAEPHIFILFFFTFQKPMYRFDTHVWSRRERGVTPHSEIIVKTQTTWASHLNSHYDFGMVCDPPPSQRNKGGQTLCSFERGGVTPHFEIIVGC